MFKKLFGGLVGGGGSAEPVACFDQRRATARRSCSLEMEVWYGRKSFHAILVNMSVGGLCLKCSTPQKVKPKAVLRVTYPEPIPKVDVMTVDCLVRWVRTRDSDGSQMIGVEFKDKKGMGKSWVKAKMQDIGFRPYNLKDQRKNFRLPCHLKTDIVLGGGTLDGVVKNIGLGGLLVQMAKPLRAGAEVDIKLTGAVAGTYTGTVRHQQHPDPGSPFSHGLAFSGLTDEQSEGIKAFLIEQQKSQWGKAGPTGEDFMTFMDIENPHEDVEIPDLDAIMEETYVEEPEESEEEEK